MANNNRCGCVNRRNNNSGYGCLDCLGGRRCWDNYPIYNGPCPNEDGEYGCDVEKAVADRGIDCDGRRCRCAHFGTFSAMMPVAVAANGMIPLVCNNCVGTGEFPVNSGLITLPEGGVYLATYTVRVPDGAAVDSTITLNVNDASQSTAIAEVGGTAPNSFTAQAIFEARDNATLALRSSEAINITSPNAQPLFTLSLVKLD